MPDPADIQPITPSLPSADVADDPAFVGRLRAGDPAAFEQLVRETTGRMLTVARRFLVQEEDARDAVQEAYLSAFRSLPAFAAEAKVSTWLHRIVVNACLMRLRTRRRRPESSLEGLTPAFRDDGHHETTAVLWHDAPGDGIERRELLGTVREAIYELSDDFRDVILLRDIEQVETRVAAELLGISESAVKTRLHRARLALRAALDARLARASRRQSAARAEWNGATGRPDVEGPDRSIGSAS